MSVAQRLIEKAYYEMGYYPYYPPSQMGDPWDKETVRNIYKHLLKRLTQHIIANGKLESFKMYDVRYNHDILILRMGDDAFDILRLDNGKAINNGVMALLKSDGFVIVRDFSGEFYIDVEKSLNPQN